MLNWLIEMACQFPLSLTRTRAAAAAASGLGRSEQRSLARYRRSSGPMFSTNLPAAAGRSSRRDCGGRNNISPPDWPNSAAICDRLFCGCVATESHRKRANKSAKFDGSHLRSPGETFGPAEGAAAA